MFLDYNNENLIDDNNMDYINNPSGSFFENNYNGNYENEASLHGKEWLTEGKRSFDVQFYSEIKKKEPDIDKPICFSTKAGSKDNNDNENQQEKTVFQLLGNIISLKGEEEEKKMNDDKKNETNDNNFITFDDIKKDIFPKLDLPEKTKNKININKEIIKRIEEKKPILMYLGNTTSSEAKDSIKPKFGRAKLGDKSIRKHNKYYYDRYIVFFGHISCEYGTVTFVTFK